MPVLRADSHFTAIEAMLKGYSKWRAKNPNHQVRLVYAMYDAANRKQNIVELEMHLETWCHKLLGMTFDVSFLILLSTEILTGTK